jgi:hypothetical protein
MAVCAVAGLVDVRAERCVGRTHFGYEGRRRVGEPVTQRAVRARGMPQLLEGLALGVPNLALVSVARGAALRQYRPHFVLADGVTGVTAHLLLEDVHLVAVHLS